MLSVSVIVPVYKSEPYLCRCIDSILNQSFTDFELILVDDGSPDCCPSICDEYAERDSRVRVIHQRNAGAAAARNSGISMAKGHYFMFCDSDDIVSQCWIEHLMQCVSENKLVLPMCAYCDKIDSLGTMQKTDVETQREYDVEDYLLFNRAGLSGYLCNALYRKDIIEEYKIRFRENQKAGDYNEDLLFAISYAKHVDSIIYNGFADYCYCYRKNSLSHSYRTEYFLKYIEKFQIWDLFLQEIKSGRYEENMQVIATMYLYHYLIALEHTAKGENASFYNFSKIVNDPTVQRCLHYADSSQENQSMIFLLKHRQAFLLWIRFKIHQLKEGILK